MTDNEIIKGLECCQDKNGYTCDDCPYQEIKHFDKEKGFEIMPNGMTYDTLSCDMWLQEDTLDLINRLQAENEKYEGIKEQLGVFWDLLLKLSIAKRKEKPTLEEFAEALQEHKAEAYKEFWNNRPERLNEKCKGKEEYNKGWNACLDEFWDIRNNLLYEVGEDK